MKKYLMMGAAALTIGFAFVSCSSDDEIYNPNAAQEKLAKTYAEAFVQQFGQPAANQTWGFGQAAKSRMTRSENAGSVIKPDNGRDGIFEFTNDEKNDPNWRSPEGVAKYVAPITEDEAAWVQDWFDHNPDLSTEGRDFDNFYVQQVANNLASNEVDNKDGYFWSTETGTYTKTEGRYKVKMDQLRIGPSTTVNVHINDYNATNGFNAWNAIYVQNGSSKQFGYHESYGDSWQWLFRCVELTVPGTCFKDGVARKGWYVGLSYFCDKKETNQKGVVIGEDEKTLCNDWILKIVPGDLIDEDQIKEQGRIFCEDLGTIGDFDFNDVVFDAKLYESGKIDIEVLAAGGTLPIAVADRDITIGQMSNTGVNNDRGTQSFSISAKEAIEKGWTELNDIPITVKQKDNAVVTLEAPKGKVPQKFCAPIGTEWADEYENINKAYPDFAKWVKGDVTREDCFANKVDKYVDLKLPNND